MSKPRYLPAALAALDDIYTYTLNTWGEEQAKLYVEGLFTACEHLPPDAPRAIPKALGVSGFVSVYHHHRIYWRQPQPGNIIIVTILHERMDQATRLHEIESG